MRRNLIFLFVLIFCACDQYTSKAEQAIDTGLRIENGINRGVSYTDPQGNDYNLRYIPISITNDSTIPICIELAFAEGYVYSTSNGDENFEIIPLPREWALDGVEITDSMMNEIANYIQKPMFKEMLEPGEKWLIAIGTLYPRPPKLNGILPNSLFVHHDQEVFPNCDWRMKKETSSNARLPLGLQLNFGENCMIIPCGLVAYSKS